MGFKSKATKANKAKKEDRQPIARSMTGEQFTGHPSHIKRTRETATNANKTAESMFLRELGGESTGIVSVKSNTPNIVDKRTLADHLKDGGVMRAKSK